MAELLASIIGVDEGTASMYLDMAGGDVDAAVSLFFSMSEGQMSNGPGCDAPVEAGAAAARPDWLNVVWPSSEPLPEAWLGQSLAFTDGLRLPQPKNGPCGVLA